MLNKQLRRFLLGRPTTILSSFHTKATSFKLKVIPGRKCKPATSNGIIECQKWSRGHGASANIQLEVGVWPELRWLFFIATSSERKMKIRVCDLNYLLRRLQLLTSFLAKVSSSKVKYCRMAPLVGLDPSQGLQDAPTMKMHRARIPNFLFKRIITDIDVFLMQYGPPSHHKTERARSRFLAPASIYINKFK